MKKSLLLSLVFLLSVIFAGQAQDIQVVNIKFPDPVKPKTEVHQNQNWYTNHFTVTASYKMEIELKCQLPPNTSFNVRTYAIIDGKYIALGEGRTGTSNSYGRVFATYDIYPSNAQYYGHCQFIVIVDADNEIIETNETPSSNQWTFQAMIHPPGETF